jgi:preprotein translocase subunit SecE
MLSVKEWWPTARDFFRDAWSEMKKVSWPARGEVTGTTVVVIIACFLFGFYLFVVDSGLAWVVDKIYKATGVVGA